MRGVFVLSRRKLADKRISRSPNSVQGRVWDFDGILLGGSTETDEKKRPGAGAILHDLEPTPRMMSTTVSWFLRFFNPLLRVLLVVFSNFPGMERFPAMTSDGQLVLSLVRFCNVTCKQASKQYLTEILCKTGQRLSTNCPKCNEGEEDSEQANTATNMW